MVGAKTGTLGRLKTVYSSRNAAELVLKEQPMLSVDFPKVLSETRRAFNLSC